MYYADAVFGNANVHTLDEAASHASAFAVKDGRFLAVGEEGEVECLRGPLTKVYDMGGLTILPGFNDAHCHPLSLRGQQLLQIDLSPAKTPDIASALAAIREAARGSSPGKWILAGGLDSAKMSEKRPPSRAELDEASPRNPVHIRYQTCHAGVVNSAALSLAGITRETPNPKGGEFERDAAGELTGLCKEEAHFLFVSGMGGEGSVVPPYTDEENAEALRRACAEYASFGITSAGDALCGPAEIRAYTQAFDEGTLSLRAYLEILDIWLPLLKRLGIKSCFGNEWVKIGAIKSFVDGATAGHTAWLSEPYLGRPEYFGLPTKTASEIEALVMEAHQAGMQIEVHANGDRAIEMLLDAYEKAQNAFPRKNPRHRIAHCTVVNDKILERIKKLGIVVCPFTSYVWEHAEKLAPYGQRVEKMFAFRSFLDYGIHTAAGSDHPCGTQNPWAAIESMVTRKSRSGGTVGLSQRITVEEALRVYTTGGAYATFEENVKGKIKEGFLADFIVCSADPLKVETEALHGIRTEQTWVGGKSIFGS